MYTVIVADDEQEIRRSLIRKVDWGSVGFQVIGEAENGAEALELMERAVLICSMFLLSSFCKHLSIFSFPMEIGRASCRERVCVGV